MHNPAGHVSTYRTSTSAASIRRAGAPLIRRPLAVALMLAAVAPAEAHASGHLPFATLPVTSCADDGSAGTLRSVVAGAASGDIVDLSGLTCGTITLLQGQVAVHVNDLTILGPGRDALTIDGDSAGRVFFHDGAGTFTISSLTIANGRTDTSVGTPTPTLLWGARGGCILSIDAAQNFTSNVTLTDATVTGCSAVSATAGTFIPAQGGGVYAGHSITLVRSTVSNNAVTGSGPGLRFGGALRNLTGSVTLTDSVVSGNRAETSYVGASAIGGGGISGRDISLTGSHVENNYAGCTGPYSTCSALGGGIEGGDSALTITTSVIAGNKVQASDRARGGGIYGPFHYQPGRLISDTTISGNTAFSDSTQAAGGGIFAWSGNLAISGSTISGNRADLGGGIAADYYGATPLTIANSTLSGNSAANAGALYLGHSSGYYGDSTQPIVVRNSTIAANTSSAANSIGGILDTHTSGGPSTFQSTILAGNGTVDLAVLPLGAITGANNLILAAPGVSLPSGTLNTDPLLGPLQDNGGPTFTHALLQGSPAIDAGNNASGLAFDQRGNGYLRVIGTAADIGAFEVQAGSAPPTVLKSFAPSSIPPGPPEIVSTLTITLGNANTSAATLSAALTDLLPSPIVVAGTPNAVTDCPGGAVTAMPASGSVTLAAGASIPAAGTCTITVAVSSATEGIFTNTIPVGALQTNAGNNVDPASANLTVSADAALPPVAVDDHYTLRGNTTLTVPAPGILGNDYDPQDGIIAMAPGSVGQPQAGALSVTYSTGAFSYAALPGFVGTDHFDYEIENGWFAFSNTATVWLTVTAPNQVPVAADDTYVTPVDTPLIVDVAHGVLANDTDPDGDPLIATLVTSTPTGLLYLYPDGHLLYTPSDGFIGTTQFTYEANDGNANSNVATVTITVGEAADRIFTDGFDS